MTPDEAKVLNFMTQEDRSLSDARLTDQLGWSHAALGLRIDALQRALLVEQDGHYYRMRPGAQAALEEFRFHHQTIPFDPKRGWR